MTTTSIESPEADRTTVRERAADALRHAAHVSHEARLLKTLATDAVEDGMHAVKRAIRETRQNALDTRDEVTYRIKREPLKAVALALAAGAVLGVAFWLAWRRATRPRDAG